IAALELEADLALAEIAKRTGLQEHSVRYYLSGLEERGVMKRVPLINLSIAGYSYYGIYFSSGSKKKDLKAKLLKELMRRREFVWLAEMGGEFDFGTAVCARNMSEIYTILTAITEKFPAMFEERAISCQFAEHHFPRRYLRSAPTKGKGLTIDADGG